AVAVSVVPLEVVHQAPLEVALHGHAVGGGALDRGQSQPTVEVRKYVRPSCAHSRPCRARRSRWSVQLATCGSLQALWATPASRGNSRKDRSSKSEIVSAQIAASTPPTCAARPGPSASAGFQSND